MASLISTLYDINIIVPSGDFEAEMLKRDWFVLKVMYRIEPKVCLTPVFHAALRALFDDGAGYQYAMNEAYLAAYDAIPLAEMKNYRDPSDAEWLISNMTLWFADNPDPDV